MQHNHQQIDLKSQNLKNQIKITTKKHNQITSESRTTNKENHKHKPRDQIHKYKRTNHRNNKKLKTKTTKHQQQ